MSGGEWAIVAAAVAGGVISYGGTILEHWWSNRKQHGIDKSRKGLLRKALNGAKGQGWMRIETLAHIVGCDLENARALLIEIDARGSMKTEKEVWSLISRNPLPTGDD